MAMPVMCQDRQTLIPGFNQEALEKARVILVGGGGIGSKLPRLGEKGCRPASQYTTMIRSSCRISIAQHFFACDIGCHKGVRWQKILPDTHLRKRVFRLWIQHSGRNRIRTRFTRRRRSLRRGNILREWRLPILQKTKHSCRLHRRRLRGGTRAMCSCRQARQSLLRLPLSRLPRQTQDAMPDSCGKGCFESRCRNLALRNRFPSDGRKTQLELSEYPSGWIFSRFSPEN